MTPLATASSTQTRAAAGADRGPPAVTTDRPMPLARDWYARPVLTVARDLLGAIVVRETTGPGASATTWRIVEVEAYDGPWDRASHARAGRTVRTAPMFGPPGHAYVYLVYGMHHCLNVVAHVDGAASAVLIRALEPLGAEPATQADSRIAAGPGLVGRALSLDRSLSGHDLTCADRLWLTTGTPVSDTQVLRGPRIGVGYAGPDWAHRPWRFGIRGSGALSRPLPPTAVADR